MGRRTERVRGEITSQSKNFALQTTSAVNKWWQGVCELGRGAGFSLASSHCVVGVAGELSPSISSSSWNRAVRRPADDLIGQPWEGPREK